MYFADVRQRIASQWSQTKWPRPGKGLPPCSSCSRRCMDPSPRVTWSSRMTSPASSATSCRKRYRGTVAKLSLIDKYSRFLEFGNFGNSPILEKIFPVPLRILLRVCRQRRNQFGDSYQGNGKVEKLARSLSARGAQVHSRPVQVQRQHQEHVLRQLLPCRLGMTV